MKISLKMYIRHIIVCVCTLLVGAEFAVADMLKERWQIGQLDQPESVVNGPNGRYLYISNINGQAMELNGLGYISRMTVEGKMLDQTWVSGLNAPKGMAIANGLLYVADMQTLHVIDLENASVIKQHTVLKAKMLNDVTVSDDGTVYVSDLLGGGLYRLQNNKFELWLSHSQLPHPNGVLWYQGGLLVANWGEDMQADFSTKLPGTLYRLNIQTKKLTPEATGYHLGNLDGIVVDNGAIYVSDWLTGELYQLANNERHRISRFPTGLADIGGAGKGIIYAPLMMDNRVLALEIMP